MQTHLAHLQLNVQPANISFYQNMFEFLGWSVLYAGEGMLGVGSGNTSLWFVGQADAAIADYDGPGLNHLAIGAPSIADVDAAAIYLAEKSIAAMFDTPRHRPEFSHSDEHTYYQVMFETPDRILIEIVYTGPKAA